MTDVPTRGVRGQVPTTASGTEVGRDTGAGPGSGSTSSAWPAPWPGSRVLGVAAIVAVLLSATVLLTTVLTLPGHRAEQLNSTSAVVLLTVGMAGLAVAGAVLVRRHPRSTIGWLMLGTALAWVVGNLSLVVALALLDAGRSAAEGAGWVTNWAWAPSYGLSMVMFLRLPTGRLPSGRWRPVELAAILWVALTVLVTAFLPGPLGADVLAPLTNPLGLEALAPVGELLLNGLFGVLPVLVVAAAAAPVVRWRRAGTRERGALRWIAMAAVVVGLSAPLALVTSTGEILQGVAGLLLPFAIGIAVLREELWDLDLRHRYDRLRAAREEERERLRSELHDSLGPVLGSISMRAEAARNLLDAGDTARIDALLAGIGTATEDALVELRRLIDDLGPGALSEQDLAGALRQHVAAYAGTFPVVLSTRPDPLPPLTERAAATAFLAVSESVRNAARHSGGTGGVVRLEVRGDRLTVEVRDDGRGIADAPAGVGRAGMARRAAEEGGRLSVTEDPDGGTLVRLELPGARR